MDPPAVRDIDVLRCAASLNTSEHSECRSGDFGHVRRERIDDRHTLSAILNHSRFPKDAKMLRGRGDGAPDLPGNCPHGAVTLLFEERENPQPARLRQRPALPLDGTDVIHNKDDTP